MEWGDPIGAGTTIWRFVRNDYRKWMSGMFFLLGAVFFFVRVIINKDVTSHRHSVTGANRAAGETPDMEREIVLTGYPAILKEHQLESPQAREQEPSEFHLYLPS